MIIEGRPVSALRLPFTLLFVAALALGVAAAILISPIAAMGVAAAGFRFPFPRIFDRTVMVTLAVAVILFARPLRLVRLLKDGFLERQTAANSAAGFSSSLWQRPILMVLGGLALALITIGVLFAIAVMMGAGGPGRAVALLARAGRYAGAAIVIAIIEECFFRAFLLGGMTRDFGRGGALMASSIVYALAHLVRAPAHYYLAGYHPGAGLHDFVLSVARLTHPASSLAMLVGLFLLGVVLGEAFLLTGSVYFSIGLHTGFVIGAKSWPVLGDHGARVPQWLAGSGRVPIIGGAAAWLLALVLMALLPILLGRAGSRAQVTAKWDPQAKIAK